VLSAWGAGGQVKDRDDEVRTWWKRKAACMLEGGTSMIPFTTAIAAPSIPPYATSDSHILTRFKLKKTFVSSDIFDPI
jgi:hypothetical protein